MAKSKDPLFNGIERDDQDRTAAGFPTTGSYWPQTTGVGPIWVTVLLQAEDNMRLRKDLRTLAEEFGKAVPWS